MVSGGGTGEVGKRGDRRSGSGIGRGGGGGGEGEGKGGEEKWDIRLKNKFWANAQKPSTGNPA